MLSKIKIICAGIILGLFFASPTYAARFYLSPSSGNMIKGCNKTIDVMMDLTGEHSNAGQIYIDHNFVSGEYISLSQSGGKFETYTNFSSLPAGRVGILGYGEDVDGPAQKFGQIVIRSSAIGTTKNLNIYFDPTVSVTSKIADLYTSSNILSSVISGSYDVIDGYCETAPPYLSNMVPTVDKPNHPVTQDITFDLKDEDSGVDISTLSITLKQNGVDVPFVLTTTKVNSGDDKIYSVNINPNSDLIREVKVDVRVIVSDKATNIMDRSYSFNDLTCEQLGCFASPIDCTTTIPVTNTIYVTTTEYITTTEYVTTTVVQYISDPGNIMPIKFYLDNRAVEAVIYNDEISTLSGTILTASADTSNLNEAVNSIKLILEGKEMPMYYDNALKTYSADLTDLITAGFYQGSIVVNYGSDKTIVSNFTISVLSRGYVNFKTTKDTTPFSGVKVTLQRMVGGEYVFVKSITTNENGDYGFVVPNDNYRLVFTAPNFDDVYTSGFNVVNNIINRNQTFIEKISLLDPEITLTEKIDYVAGVAGEKGQQVLDLAQDPKVEKAMQNYTAPIALGTAVAATVPALSLINLLSYLRFLFLQPILLLGARRRKKWGVVYNSLTRMPVDLAIVRLLDANTNRVVQSRVTDAQGRYVFLANPGTYRLVVEKNDFIFPSKILQDFKEDTEFLDIYHGEIIHVDENYTAISANIPLDIVGVAEKTPRRIIWDKRWKSIQSFVASLSVVAGLLAVIISPSIWTGLLLVSQILLYYLFKRVAHPKKPKSWGIVYDKNTSKPVGKAVARLFSKQFNKLVLTEITDNNGRYSFMVGPNEYFVTFEKDGYQKATTGDIKIKEKDEVIKVDTGMERVK